MDSRWRRVLRGVMRKKQQYNVDMQPSDKYLTTVDMTCTGILLHNAYFYHDAIS